MSAVGGQTDKLDRSVEELRLGLKVASERLRGKQAASISNSLSKPWMKLAATCWRGFAPSASAYTLSKRSHMRVTLLFPYVSTSVQSLLNVLSMVTLAA